MTKLDHSKLPEKVREFMLNGGPVFPTTVKVSDRYGTETDFLLNGMSRRDWFAGQAAAALLQTAIAPSECIEDYARCAFELADAMLKESDRRNGK